MIPLRLLAVHPVLKYNAVHLPEMTFFVAGITDGCWGL